MKSKFYGLTFVAALLIGSFSGCVEHEQNWHHQTNYVPWGVDEFELIGLTKEELAQKFKGTLCLNKDGSEVYWEEPRSSHFQVSFDQQGRVATIQRHFIDGAGCVLKGPVLTSKREALEFSINGLSSLSALDQRDQAKLATAQALLKEAK